MLFQTERADWGFIIPAILIWVFSIAATTWDFFYLQKMLYHFNMLSVIGAVLFCAGISIRVVGERTLGKNYSQNLKPPEKLVTQGIYKHIRHPIYTAMIFYTTGLPLIFSSICGFLLSLFFIPFTLYRIRIEEKMLTKEFGDKYIEYKRKTKKLIPYIY